MHLYEYASLDGPCVTVHVVHAPNKFLCDQIILLVSSSVCFDLYKKRNRELEGILHTHSPLYYHALACSGIGNFNVCNVEMLLVLPCTQCE